MPADLQETPVPLAEISQGPNAFEAFLDRNQKNLVILAILLVLGTAAYVIYRGIQKSHQETAGAALNKAADLPALQAVINDHPDTNAAGSAMVLLADRQWLDGQQDAAIGTLRKFIDSNPGHPALPTARASLGSKLMSQGKSADATKVFQDVIDDPNARFIAPYALISSGDIAIVAGEADKAEAFYNRVKTDFPESSFVDTATRRIATLKAKPPVEIEAPPAPKTETPPANPETAPAPSAVEVPAAATPSPTPPQEASPENRSKNSGEAPAAPQP